MGTISAPLTSHFLGTDRRYSFHSLSLDTTFFTSLVLITIFDYTSGTETSIENQVSTVSVAIYDIDSLHLNIINTTVSYLLFTYLLLIAIFDYTSAREASIEIQVSMISIHCILILSTRPFLTFFCTYLLLIAIFDYTSGTETLIEIQVSIAVCMLSIHRISIYQHDRFLPSFYLPSFNCSCKFQLFACVQFVNNE